MNKIVGIASGGGHTFELLESLNDINIAAFITAKNTGFDKCKNFPVYKVIDPHKSFLKYFVNFFQSIYLFIYLKPKVVITTGSGIAIPFCLISKLFGVKVVFIESAARVNTLSKSGKFMYIFADLFIVQSDNLMAYFPEAKLGRVL